MHACFNVWKEKQKEVGGHPRKCGSYRVRLESQEGYEVACTMSTGNTLTLFIGTILICFRDALTYCHHHPDVGLFFLENVIIIVPCCTSSCPCLLCCCFLGLTRKCSWGSQFFSFSLSHAHTHFFLFLSNWAEALLALASAHMVMASNQIKMLPCNLVLLLEYL